MGVYIPGMEMPKDGAFVEVLIWSDGHVTQTGDSYFAEDGRAYYQPCDWKYFSAVPVPEHGRLIDADALITTFCEWGTRLERGRKLVITMSEAKQAIVDIIEDAPTIILAEEDE